MKKQLYLILLLLGVALLSIMGCKKHHISPVTIIGTNTASPKPGELTGTFTATGAFNTSGTADMIVVPVGTDSIHCTYTMTAPDGTFILALDCEKPPMMSGHWQVTGGTGRYEDLRGTGPLTMAFPPDVPAGVLSTETLTGLAWFNH